MSALLHLNLVPPRYEFLIEGHIGNSMGDTLADDFEGVEAASDDISGEVNPSFDHSYCSLDRSFDKPF